MSTDGTAMLVVAKQGLFFIPGAGIYRIPVRREILSCRHANRNKPGD